MMVNVSTKAELWKVTSEIPSKIVQVSESFRASLQQAQSQNATMIVNYK